MHPALILLGYGLVLHFVLWRPIAHIDRPGLYRLLSVFFGLYLGGVLLRWQHGIPVTPAQWLIAVGGLAVFAVVFRAPSGATAGTVAVWGLVFAALLWADATGVVDVVDAHRQALASTAGGLQ